MLVGVSREDEQEAGSPCTCRAAVGQSSYLRQGREERVTRRHHQERSAGFEQKDNSGGHTSWRRGLEGKHQDRTGSRV